MSQTLLTASQQTAPFPVTVEIPSLSLVAADAAEGDHNAKCRQIFDGAREVFLAAGFDGTSMNDVARAAGVSKGTLYVYFDSKEKLFEALIRYDRSRQAEQICQFNPEDHDIRSVLQRFGVELIDTMTQPTHMAHLRTVIGVVAKFPQIGQAFFEAGPALAIGRLAAYLEAQVAGGLLVVPDCALAAEQFIDLCKSGFHMRLVFGVIGQPSLPEIISHVDRAVEAYLRIYAASQHESATLARP